MRQAPDEDRQTNGKCAGPGGQRQPRRHGDNSEHDAIRRHQRPSGQSSRQSFARETGGAEAEKSGGDGVGIEPRASQQQRNIAEAGKIAAKVKAESSKCIHIGARASKRQVVLRSSVGLLPESWRQAAAAISANAPSTASGAFQPSRSAAKARAGGARVPPMVTPT